MVEIPEHDSDFLNGKMAYANALRVLTIIGEGAIVDTEDFHKNPIKRIELPVEFTDTKSVLLKKKWQPNKPAEDALKTIFGKDTKSMVGKKVKVFLEKYKDSYMIKVDEIETRALNQTNQASL